jgi:hypothetical protein
MTCVIIINIIMGNCRSYGEKKAGMPSGSCLLLKFSESSYCCSVWCKLGATPYLFVCASGHMGQRMILFTSNFGCKCVIMSMWGSIFVADQEVHAFQFSATILLGRFSATLSAITVDSFCWLILFWVLLGWNSDNSSGLQQRTDNITNPLLRVSAHLELRQREQVLFSYPSSK